MSLHLSDSQLRDVRELQELLTTPLRHDSPGAWFEAVHEEATRLFRVSRSLLILPVDTDRVMIDSPTIDDETLRALEEGLVGTGPEINRYGDPVLDRIMRRLAHARLEVWTRPMAERVSGIPLEETPRFYPELVRPARLDRMLVMGHSLAEGRAMFSLFADDHGPSPFDDEAVELFRLLLAAFKAGCSALALAGRRWRALKSSLDTLGEGVVLYRNGAEAHRNPAMRRTLEAEEGADRLLAECARCARTLRRLLDQPVPGRNSGDPTATFVTGANRYRLAASHLEGGVDGEPGVIMVVVRAAVPPLPDEDTLQGRYGLTRRQAEVALAVAGGRSNREIADELGISPHTARHHTQWALEKIGVDSRKALALRLLADRTL